MLSYHLAVIEQMTDGLIKVFDGGYPDTLLQAPYVGPEYPFARETYPTIIVDFTPSKTNTLGIGHFTTVVQDDGTDAYVYHWRFEGNIQFKVTALTTTDRDTISDQLIGVLAFGKKDPRFVVFWETLYRNPFISMSLLTETIQTGSPTQQPAPWGDQDMLIYQTTIGCPIMGEFYSETLDAGLVDISAVNVYPYRPDQARPKGTGDPNPWIS